MRSGRGLDALSVMVRCVGEGPIVRVKQKSVAVLNTGIEIAIEHDGKMVSSVIEEEKANSMRRVLFVKLPEKSSSSHRDSTREVQETWE